MDNGYLDKKIKEILEHPPHFEPSHKARAQMLYKLDQLESIPKVRTLPWWWLLFPAGVIIGILLDTYHPPQAAHLHSKSLEKSQPDTILIEKTVWRHDTIFIIHTQDKTSAARPTSSIWPLITKEALFNTWTYPQQEHEGSMPNTYTVPLRSPLFPSPLSLSSQNSEGRTTHATQDSTIAKVYTHSLPNALPVSGSSLGVVQLLHLSNPLLDDSRIVMSPNINYQVRLPWWYQFSPTGWHIYSMIGPSFFANEEFEDIDGISAHLGVALDFAGQTFLGVQIGFTTQQFKVEDPEVMNQFPQINPEQPGDVLSEIYARLQILEIPISIGWKPQWKKWHGLLATGLTARKGGYQKLRYKFITAQNKYSLTHAFRDNVLDVHTWHLQVGLGRQLWEGLSLSAVMQFSHDWEKGNGEIGQFQYIAPTLRLSWQWK